MSNAQQDVIIHYYDSHCSGVLVYMNKHNHWIHDFPETKSAYCQSAPSLVSSLEIFHLSNIKICCTMLLADRGREEEYHDQVTKHETVGYTCNHICLSLH
jgi:hypothetical protein